MAAHGVVQHARLDTDPADLEARYQLSAVLAVNGEIEQAMDHLLGLMKASRTFGDDAGRKGLIATFEILGAGDPRVGRYRQQMASLLY